MPDNYLALTPESLPERLCKICQSGSRSQFLGCCEVGDGNLNLVFIVTGDLKQALPYVRLVGDI